MLGFVSLRTSSLCGPCDPSQFPSAVRALCPYLRLWGLTAVGGRSQSVSAWRHGASWGLGGLAASSSDGGLTGPGTVRFQLRSGGGGPGRGLCSSKSAFSCCRVSRIRFVGKSLSLSTSCRPNWGFKCHFPESLSLTKVHTFPPHHPVYVIYST